MDQNLQFKVSRLNELFVKAENGEKLSTLELREQASLRDELINYFKFAIEKIAKNKHQNE